MIKEEIMKKLSIVCLAVAMAVVFGFGSAFATQPASKATAKCGDVRGIVVGDDYQTIFSQDIKTPTGKDLFIDVSLECGITTNTAVMSKALERALATAEASVMIKVLVDGDEVLPGEICFASRMQTLVAEFAGDFSDCISLVDTDNDGMPDAVVVDEECTQAEFLQLILKTLNANSFNFIATDLVAGVHKIEVQAKLIYTDRDGAEVVVDRPELDGTTYAWSHSASNAWLGKGSVTVELVRMIKDEDVELVE